MRRTTLLKGIVQDKSKQPVSYVSVALLASDSTTLVTGAISDDKGFRVISE